MAPTEVITSEELSHNQSGELQQVSTTYEHRRSLKLLMLNLTTLARKGECFDAKR